MRNLIGQSLTGDVIIQTRYTMALLVVYWLYTRGFSFDRPLGLRPRALSKLATRVKPVNHAPPSYNLYMYNIHTAEVVLFFTINVLNEERRSGRKKEGLRSGAKS